MTPVTTVTTFWGVPLAGFFAEGVPVPGTLLETNARCGRWHNRRKHPPTPMLNVKRKMLVLPLFPLFCLMGASRANVKGMLNVRPLGGALSWFWCPRKPKYKMLNVKSVPFPFVLPHGGLRCEC